MVSAGRRYHPIHRKDVFSVDPRQIAAASSSAEFHRVEPGSRNRDEIAEIGELSGETPSEVRAMRERLARGDWCTVGLVDGDLAFYCWSMFGEMEVGARIQPVHEGIVYSYKMFTAPAHRGRRIASSYYGFLAHELAERPGAGRVVATVVAANVSSIALHRRCGFARAGAIVEIRAAGACIGFPNADVKHLFR